MSDPVSTQIVAITAGASGIGRVVAEAFPGTGLGCLRSVTSMLQR